jgi:hypothetical protein
MKSLSRNYKSPLVRNKYCKKHNCQYQGLVCVACVAQGHIDAVKTGVKRKEPLYHGEGQRDIDPDLETIRLRAAQARALTLGGVDFEDCKED